MTKGEIDIESGAAFALHKDILLACAKHNLGARATTYTLCVVTMATAQAAELQKEDVWRILEKLGDDDLLPLLTPLLAMSRADDGVRRSD